MARRRPRRFIKEEEIKRKQAMKESQWKEIWAHFSSAYGFGITLLSGMIIGFLIGHYIDVWLHTGVMFTLGFVSLGIYISFDIFIREIMKKKDK
jgi:F0F1-type ATP synthase assembly protein I